jgi:hypothetical protein
MRVIADIRTIRSGHDGFEAETGVPSLSKALFRSEPDTRVYGVTAKIASSYRPAPISLGAKMP